MISRRTATTFNLTVILILGGLFLAAASESPPRQLPPAEFVLDGTNQGQPDSTRVAPVYRAAPTGNWVIHYDPNTPLSEKWEYVHRIGGSIVERLDALEIWVVDVPEAFGSGDFTFDSDVELVEQDFVVSVQVDYPPNDPDFDRQWALPHIQAQQAWDQMGELKDITVAVIDTGVCMSHEDLVDRVLDTGYDFVDNDDDPEDVFGHGCSVAGIIAANTNNGIGIAGFAPNSSILPVRVLGPSGSGSMADVAAGIVYAADNGADIINLSLGSMVGSQVTEDAVNHAVGKGVTVIASAGNSGGALPGFPARYENVVAVGAIDPNGARSSFSNKGGDIWAPGRDVHTIYLDNGYKALNGTSFSAPYVAAMAALLEGMGQQLHLDGGDMTWTCMRQGACEIVPGS